MAEPAESETAFQLDLKQCRKVFLFVCLFVLIIGLCADI